MISKISVLYAAGEVKRLHTVPTHRTQNIAEHVYGSLIIAHTLCIEEQLSVEDTHKVFKTLLYHDAPEIDTGDVPAPVKRASKELDKILLGMEVAFYHRVGIDMPELTTKLAAIVKASDTLDLAFTCLREKMLGNGSRVVYKVFTNCMNYLDDQININSVRKLREQLIAEWTGCPTT